ncbi:MAG: hypothetical protein AB1778_00095 [Candidatus Bipolaricaulota bacterium]
MKLRGAVAAGCFAGLLIAGSLSACAAFRSIGLRFVLPVGGMPALLGVEASASMAFGRGAATLFLAADGRALITLSADVRLAESGGRGESFLRLTAALSSLDPLRWLPSVAAGVGIAFGSPVFSRLSLGIAGEFLYPLAFPLPMLTVAGAWEFL